jgi:hypothetical protein
MLVILLTQVEAFAPKIVSRAMKATEVRAAAGSFILIRNTFTSFIFHHSLSW